jgi:hypothetical protein
MPKALKYLGISMLAFAAIGIGTYCMLNEPEPDELTGEDADALAMKMLTAIGHSAWDSTHYLQWTFRNGNNYLWDKQRNLVRIVSKKELVLLNANDLSGLAWSDGELLKDEMADRALNRAWTSFCNDGFWVYAPFKVYDPGTVRSVVSLKDGTKGLKVTYMEGGVTPGDSYVWLLDETGRPRVWKLWVQIIPIGGLSFSWDNWVQLSTGAWLATDHRSAVLHVPISDLKGGRTLQELGAVEDPFAILPLRIVD